MKETKFKTLMYCGNYVDANLLHKGVYNCSNPFLYNMGETIETLIERAKSVEKTHPVQWINKDYYDNLNSCELIEINITF